MTNKAFSKYNGLLVTLHRKMSQGLQFDVNYTWSHSLDNISAPANQAFGSNGRAEFCATRSTSGSAMATPTSM